MTAPSASQQRPSPPSVEMNRGHAMTTSTRWSHRNPDLGDTQTSDAQNEAWQLEHTASAAQQDEERSSSSSSRKRGSPNPHAFADLSNGSEDGGPRKRVRLSRDGVVQSNSLEERDEFEGIIRPVLDQMFSNVTSILERMQGGAMKASQFNQLYSRFSIEIQSLVASPTLGQLPEGTNAAAPSLRQYFPQAAQVAKDASLRRTLNPGALQLDTDAQVQEAIARATREFLEQQQHSQQPITPSLFTNTAIDPALDNLRLSPLPAGHSSASTPSHRSPSPDVQIISPTPVATKAVVPNTLPNRRRAPSKAFKGKPTLADQALSFTGPTPTQAALAAAEEAEAAARRLVIDQKIAAQQAREAAIIARTQAGSSTDDPSSLHDPSHNTISLDELPPTRSVWTKQETDTLLRGIDVCGSGWAEILQLFGAGGVVNQHLAARSQVNCKDKARNLKVSFQRKGLPVPKGLAAITGDYEKRGRNKGSSAGGVAELKAEVERGENGDGQAADGEGGQNATVGS